jgi:hypothetical protein
LSQGLGLTFVLGDFLGESLSDGDVHGCRFPVESVALPSTGFLGQKPGPSRTCDGGIPDVTTFLKASLLKFVSATTSPFGCCFRFSATGMRVEVRTCSVKSKLSQGMWLNNDDVTRAPLLREVRLLQRLSICRCGVEDQVWKSCW